MKISRLTDPKGGFQSGLGFGARALKNVCISIGRKSLFAAGRLSAVLNSSRHHQASQVSQVFSQVLVFKKSVRKRF